MADDLIKINSDLDVSINTGTFSAAISGGNIEDIEGELKPFVDSLTDIHNEIFTTINNLSDAHTDLNDNMGPTIINVVFPVNCVIWNSNGADPGIWSYPGTSWQYLGYIQFQNETYSYIYAWRRTA